MLIALIIALLPLLVLIAILYGVSGPTPKAGYFRCSSREGERFSQSQTYKKDKNKP